VKTSFAFADSDPPRRWPSHPVGSAGTKKGGGRSIPQLTLFVYCPDPGEDHKAASAMKMIGWNCQGKGKNLHNSSKIEFLDRLMLSTGVQITFVSETRTSRYNSSQLNNRFNIADSFVVPSIGLSGGLWLYGMMKSE
jgi:hypothetical protein